MPRKPSQEERAKKYMKLLNVNYDEALQMVIDDDTIDNGGKCDWEVELTPEQKKIVRKARMADREVKMEKTKRTRKENPDKQNLIEKFREVLEMIPDGCAETFPFDLIEDLREEYGVGETIQGLI